MRSERADEETLRRCLERIVPEICGRRSAIARLDRRRHDLSSSYASDIVIVQLTAGEEFRVFLKDFGFSRLRKDAPDQQRDRELRVYRDLLAGADLGTPRYYGSVWEESRGRFWLLLEFVNGTPVAHCEFEHWVAAAGWLGRLHGYFAQHSHRLADGGFLLRHDAEFFGSMARRALAAVSAISASVAGRLARILSPYDGRVELMASQPPTAVHGSYKPRNILADVGARPVRICPVDWELAAAGSACYDLAFLCEGFEPPWLDRMLDTYRREAGAHGAPLPDREGMRYLVDCFRLHKVLKTLSGAQERRFSESRVAQLVDAGERLSHSVPGGIR